eukprot:737453-Hanusia_phi.AAC.1
MPQLPWGNLTSSTVRCSLTYNWSTIISKKIAGRIQMGGLGHLMQRNRCVLNPALYKTKVRGLGLRLRQPLCAASRRLHVLRLRRGAGSLPPLGSRLPAPPHPGESRTRPASDHGVR